MVFDFGKGLLPSPLIPDVSLRRLITGLIFAGSGSLVAISPFGKLSGVHINPSVSLAFWAHGKMKHLDLIGYILAQFVGAIVGEVLLVFVWRNHARSVTNGMTLPIFFVLEHDGTFRPMRNGVLPTRTERKSSPCFPPEKESTRAHEAEPDH